ncbi:EVE domain-containing protein [Candidatus Neptunichlamydia sp. REUL1]|uniref:EVE domain-containing protein n=1 Tax=Candidatus Neptunichlamydia sp. REUL1 TaxID=3064277 RepID=UPI0029303F6B|nr:EVE domain-containing protein [Candidatus Neptunochlamydia sp. REUL1]
MRYWLIKSEPTTYSIDDLKRLKQDHWEGVRNYQARNFMRDEMRVGDLALFYHSNATPPGVVGVARVCREAHPDFFAWDPESKYFDPKSSPDNPRWMMVDVEFVEKFSRLIPLEELRGYPELEEMVLLQKGSRLSVQRATKAEFTFIRKLGVC